METLTEISRWIRDYGHEPRHMQRLLSVRFDWFQLWTALDIVDDVELAIRAYLETDFPDESGEQYLRIYGIFQALFVQQDAIDHLIKVIRPAMALRIADVLKDVREFRNSSIGHPTSLKRKGGETVYLINRSSMGKDGFSLVGFSDQHEGSHRYVPVRDLIEKLKS